MALLIGVVSLGGFLWMGEAYGYLRAAIAVAMFLGIFLFAARYFRSMMAVPPEPERADVSEYGLKYVCTMCGLELKVEVAARDKPPTHCAEPMELVRTGGRPPLKSV